MTSFLVDLLDTVLYNNSFWSEYDALFYTLIICSILYAIYINYDELRANLTEKREKLITILLVLSVLVGGFFRITNMSFESNAYDSTWEYINGARYFSETNRIFKCYGPNFYNCGGATPVSHPALFSLILGSIYSFIGYSLGAVIFLSIFVSILTIPLSYISVKTFFEDKKIGLAAAIILSVFPIHAIYSGNLDFAISVFSVFSIFFVILATGIVIKNDTKNSWILLMASYLFTVSFRWEHPFVILFSLALIVSSKKDTFSYIKEKLSETWFWIYGMIFSLLAVAPLKGIYTVWFRHESLGRSFTAEFFVKNFSLAHELLSRLYNIPGLMLFLLIPFAFREDKKKSSIFIIWWLTYILLYSFFRNGLTDRYVMNSLPPLILLGCMGLKNLFRNIKIREKIGQDRLIVLFSIIMLLTVFISIPGQDPLISYEVHKRDDIGGFNEITNELDKPLLVPEVNTLLAFLTESDRTVYSFLTISLYEHLDNPGEIYFLNSERCKFEPAKNVCQKILEHSEKTDITLNEWEIHILDITSEEWASIVEKVSDKNF